MTKTVAVDESAEIVIRAFEKLTGLVVPQSERHRVQRNEDGSWSVHWLDTERSWQLRMKPHEN